MSTVFLGIDHNFSLEGPPLLFETMIFGGPHDSYQERYATLGEAREGHAKALALAKGRNGMIHKSPRPSLEIILAQQPTKKTSLLKLFCPLCGEMASTEKESPHEYRVSCGSCGARASVMVGTAGEKQLEEGRDV